MNSQDQFDVACTGGARITVRRHARAGAPRLLLSHGNGFAIDGYRKFWELLLPDFELCLFDLRNHGQNPRAPVESHTVAAMAQDQCAIQQAIGDAFGPRTTIGLFHSISSIAAIRAAQDHGAAWDALVLDDPPLIAPQGNPLREMNEKLDPPRSPISRAAGRTISPRSMNWQVNSGRGSAAAGWKARNSTWPGQQRGLHKTAAW